MKKCRFHSDKTAELMVEVQMGLSNVSPVKSFKSNKKQDKTPNP